MKEAAELSASSSSPSPYFYAQPESDSNLFSWHFTLAGPPSPTPYANGIYHGRIDLPPQYPLRPPSFRFLTPSGRFEVNREICLSISGHHEETWQPAWGIRTALIAIRSFMEGEAKGQVGGMDAKEEARKEWAVKSRKWRCEACEKTNEEVLNEWREVCKEKGVGLDDGESGQASQRDAVPEELKLGYRDELGKGGEKDKDEDNKGQTEKDTSQAAGTSETPTPASEQPSTGTNLPPTSSSTQSTSLSPSQTSHTPTPTATSSSSSPAPPRQPTSTTQSPPPQNPPTTVTRADASTSSDGAWLDRAIIGLVLALIFMITRRVVLSDED